MKTKFSLLLLLLASLSFGLIGCSGDDDNNKPLIDEEMNIAIDKELVDIAMEESASVKITEGNGEYNAFSLNKDVAIVNLSGDSLKIQGVGAGKTSVIISDRETRLKVLPVVVYRYNEIVLEKSTVEFDFLLGNVKSVPVNVLEGNGGYTAVSDNSSIQVSVLEDMITVSTIRGSAGGEANITITDVCDRTTVVKVKANAVTDPYTEDEIAEIMNITASPYFVFITTVSQNYYTYINTVENGMNVSGYEYYSYYILKIYYPGDKSVGEQNGGKIYYYNVPYGNSCGSDPVDLSYFKVVKNDGTRIWAIYSVLDRDKVLQRGYFVQNIK
ncbi:MAG: hypothetical protein LBR26_15710 [Prevotella sp.]|jgi:hypothetical protein|nr:hypothetical protein [Prevotella sp.]